jgi:predicted nucleic acid-binding protein
MTGPCFVDANVLVYACDARDPAKQRRASDWLDQLWRERLGRTSVQVISEAYVALKRLNGGNADDLWERVARYFAWAPQPIDEGLLRRAREIEQRWRLSWWDAMIVAAARLQECALLLTEDLQDGAVYETVTARSPFTVSVEEPAARYAAASELVASRHRARGRPRRTALA